MKCSECSELLFPVVAVDIDGTMANYHDHFVSFASKYLGMGIIHNDYDGSTGFREWFCGLTGVSGHTWDDIKLAYRQGAQKRSQPILPGAFMFTNALMKAGAEVWVTTTRPYLRLDGIDPDTRFWLDRHKILYYGLLYHEDKYVELDKRVEHGRVVAVLDDLPEQYDSAEEIWGRDIPILARGNWNRAIQRPNVANGLYDAEQMIVQRIKKWYENAEMERAKNVV